MNKERRVRQNVLCKTYKTKTRLREGVQFNRKEVVKGEQERSEAKGKGNVEHERGLEVGVAI